MYFLLVCSMKKKLSLFCGLLLIMCCMANYALAQNQYDGFVERMLTKAKNRLEKNQTAEALEILLDLQPSPALRPEVDKLTARAYWLARKYPLAQKYYERYFSYNSPTEFEDWIDFGLVQKSMARYDEAKDCFRLATYKSLNKEEADYARGHYESCITAMKMQKVPADVAIKPVPLNLGVAGSVFAPHPNSDGGFYFSGPDRDTLYSLGENFNLTNVYKASPPSFKVENLSNFKSINQDMRSTAHLAIHPNGKYVYFTRSNPAKGSANSSEIYLSILVDGKTQEVKRLPKSVNAHNTSNQHPMPATIDGVDYLFFVSDREDGFGQRDIYRITLDHEGMPLGQAENLGGHINSEADDDSPWYDQVEKTLYFSSNGRFGLGGYDIWKAAGGPDFLESAQLLPIPINSPFDDNWFVMPENGPKVAYIVTNRLLPTETAEQVCCDRIFMVEFSNLDKGAPLAKAEILKRKRDVVRAKSTESVKLSTIKTALMSSYTLQFQTNSFKIEAEYLPKLDSIVSLLQTNPNVKVRLEGHADYRGSEDLNNRLSADRCEAIKGYLASRNISASRIVSEHFGAAVSKKVKKDRKETNQLDADRKVEIILLAGL